jgi:hypothetical protein
LKREGRIGGVSFGIYPIDLWVRIFSSLDVDAGLVHNHYCLNDTPMTELLSIAESKQIGLIHGSSIRQWIIDRPRASSVASRQSYRSSYF